MEEWKYGATKTVASWNETLTKLENWPCTEVQIQQLTPWASIVRLSDHLASMSSPFLYKKITPICQLENAASVLTLSDFDAL
jgi:hypothetical protein